MVSINFNKLSEISEDDQEFKKDLSLALYKSLKELKEKYSLAITKEDLEGLKSIRHKLRPTLELFEIVKLQEVILEGKEIVEKNGFNHLINDHLIIFHSIVSETIDDLEQYLTSNHFINPND